MEIRIKETGQVMLESEFRQFHLNNNGPTWSITTPEILESLGADVVFEGPQATGGSRYQFSQRDGVELINGKWFTKYILGPIFTDTPATESQPAKTASENEAEYKAYKDAEQAKAVRDQRNTKLSETDWTQLADSSADKVVYATYRQALRDITKQDGFPWDINWPTL